MNEMVERVAQAIYITHPHDNRGEPISWTELTDYAKVPDRRRAIAAIAAMREPTEAMWKVQDNVSYLRDMWPAMIDAALAE